MTNNQAIKTTNTKTKIFTLLSILLITPLGFFTKLYTRNGETWINNHLGGTFYVIFWCLIVFLIFPGIKPLIIAGWVLVITVLLEFLQIFHPKFLELLMGSFIGKTILGTSFNWIDIIYYIIGWGIGIIWLLWLNKLMFFKKNKTINTKEHASSHSLFTIHVSRFTAKQYWAQALT